MNIYANRIERITATVTAMINATRMAVYDDISLSGKALVIETFHLFLCSNVDNVLMSKFSKSNILYWILSYKSNFGELSRYRYK